MDYMNAMMNPQQFNPATMTQIPYKPVTFEKLSNLIGMTYNLSSIENMNTVALPRGGEQQIFFVNNDERIYTRAFDNSVGIIGYKQDYVEKLQNDLKEAQSQLHEIFDSISKQQEETSPSIEERISQIEKRLDELTLVKENINEHSGTGKAMAAISDMA